jgi:hypothetical protein
MERFLHKMLASVGQNIMRPIRVSLKKERKILPVCLWLPPCSLNPSYVVFLHLLSYYSTGMPTLLAEVTQVWEVATAVRATRVLVVLATKIVAKEAAVAWDSTALHIKDVKDRATLVEREAWERVSRVEA